VKEIDKEEKGLGGRESFIREKERAEEKDKGLEDAEKELEKGLGGRESFIREKERAEEGEKVPLEKKKA
jgi:hypothetical protein